MRLTRRAFLRAAWAARLTLKKRAIMIAISRLCKRFDAPRGTFIDVWRDIDLEVPDRTITAVIGPSGAGKTTLSKCISLLEKPTSGSVLVNGTNLSALTGHELRTQRRAIGTIFQSSALLRRKTAAENIALPGQLSGGQRPSFSVGACTVPRTPPARCAKSSLATVRFSGHRTLPRAIATSRK